MSDISLKLNMDQVNIIMASLGRMPYESVFQLINELSQQIQPQIQTQQSGQSESQGFTPRVSDTPPSVPNLPNRPL